jgi:hypothetical protein
MLGKDFRGFIEEAEEREVGCLKGRHQKGCRASKARLCMMINVSIANTGYRTWNANLKRKRKRNEHNRHYCMGDNDYSVLGGI